jgi:lysozyme
LGASKARYGAEILNVRELIALHEGRIPYAYSDSLGYLTIGIGHLIDQRKGGRLPEPIIDALFEHDLHEHTNELFAHLPWARDLDPVRQAVLVDMYFNLRLGLLGFKETLQHFEAGRWELAAAAMLDSKWAQQVGVRAIRLATMVRTGAWP